VIPDAGRNDTTLPRDPSHLRESFPRIQHEVDDELSKRGIERLIRKGQLLCGPFPDLHVRVSRPCSCNEWLGGIDSRHCRGAYPCDQFCRQRTRAATHIDHSLTGGNPRNVSELR